MSRRSIEVIVHPDGSLAIDAVGFTCTDCAQATAFLEEALGEAVNTQRKPEYHQRARARNRQGIGRG